MEPTPFELPHDLVQQLARVRRVGVITGAGISAESGIPTYRGKGGIYDDPEEGERTVEALTGSTLRRDPDRTWRAIAALARAASGAMPNAGHVALVEIERRATRFVLLTQNVDGLHQLAGSKHVIDIHGHIFDAECIGCGAQIPLTRAELTGAERAPRCDYCGGIVRPGVVLFDELLPKEKFHRIPEEFLASPPDLVLAVGTTGMFPYIQAPFAFAAQAGRLTVEINPEATDMTEFARFHLRGPAGAFLPLIAENIPPRESA